MAFDLSDYVTVPERIALFYERFPEGSIVSAVPRVIDIGERVFIEVTTCAYRYPDDPQPAQATAWEPFPGRTPYTKESEMMNAETSAIGRAIAALGIGTNRSLASANEVANRNVSAEPRRLPAKARSASSKGSEGVPAIMAAVARLNDLPEEARVKAKSAFVSEFGAPSDLADHMVPQVEAFVTLWEKTPV